jgi:hypothetical protein
MTYRSAQAPRFATPADNDLLRSIVMHPDVRRTSAHDGAPDFDPAAYTAHPVSRAIIVAGGCLLGPALEMGAYGVHTCFMPGARGSSALREARAALQFAFTHMDAEQLYTSAPDSFPPARVFAHAMGMRDTFRRERCWTVDGTVYGMQHMRQDIDDWILASETCLQRGRAFHAQLGATGHLEHEEDPVHDRFVGAACLMVESGQVDKACRVYGRYARTAGSQPFEILSRDPLRIDIGTAILRVEAGRFFIEEH